MAFYRGPKIVTDGLVLYYDTDNVKSYVGEPTINLLTNPSFEDGLLSAWGYTNGTGGTTTIDRGRFDTYSMKVTIASAGDQYQAKGYNYGVNIAGRIFTFSCYIKTSGIVGTGIHLVTYWQDSVGSWIFSNNVSSTYITGDSDWVRISATSTAPALTYQAYFICAPVDKNGIGSYWVDDVQIEEKGHVTPFVAGTRSATNSMYSLVNTNKISTDLTNTPFASDGSIYYNANGYIYIPYSSLFDFSDAQTIAMWMKPATGAPTQRRNPFNQAYGGSGTLTHEGNGTINYYFGTNGGDGVPYVGIGSGFSVAENELAFIVVTRSQSSDICRWYKNGVLYTDTNAGGYYATNNGSSYIQIGSGYTGQGFIGNIYTTAIYNKFFTTAEVLQNYNAQKSRFGL